MSYPSERVAAIVACEGEVRHIPEGSGGNFLQYPKGGTASVACEGDPTKSGHIKFYPLGMSTLNWSTLDQESESNKACIGETN